METLPLHWRFPLDGTGAVSEGAHAAHESILLDALAPRTALLVAMIAR